MNENLILNFGEALMREGITRTINGCLDSEPLCLGASVRKESIEPGASPNGGQAEPLHNSGVGGGPPSVS